MEITVDAIEFQTGPARRTSTPRPLQIEDSEIVSIRPISPDARGIGLAPMTAESAIILQKPGEDKQQIVFLQTELPKVFNNTNEGAPVTNNVRAILAHADKVDFLPLMPRELGGVRFVITNPVPQTTSQPG